MRATNDGAEAQGDLVQRNVRSLSHTLRDRGYSTRGDENALGEIASETGMSEKSQPEEHSQSHDILYMFWNDCATDELVEIAVVAHRLPLELRVNRRRS